MEEKKQSSRRRKHKNSKLGCVQCKQRRIKCDESTPSCQKCIAREIRCGYLDYTPDELAVIARAHADAQLAQHLQAQYDTANMPFTVPIIADCYPLVPQYTLLPDATTQRARYPPSLHAIQASTRSNWVENKNTVSDSSFSSATGSMHSEASHVDRGALVFRYQETPTRSLNHVLNSSTGSSSEPSPQPSTDEEERYKTTVSTERRSTTLSLMPHVVVHPKVDPIRYPEYFDETMTGVFTRVYLFKENIQRYEVATYNPGIFDVMMLFGHGRLVSYIPQLEPYFLARRGEAMRLLISALDDITDLNARTLLLVASSLCRTSIHMMEQTIKDHQTLNSGPTAIILKGLENPELFPNALMTMQRYADGILVVYRAIYCPSYDPEVLVEFLEVINDFGKVYIHNEDLYNTDDPLVRSFDSMVEYIEYILDLTRTYKNEDYALKYPTEKLFEMLKRWFVVFPSLAFTINSKMSHVEKVFYAFWHCLSFILECCFYNCRYFFTYLFHGYYETFTMPKDVVLAGLDHDLAWYANYLCRIMAFMNRRRRYIINYALSDEFIVSSKYSQEERLKNKPKVIHEEFITKFKTTLIRPENYPREELRQYDSSHSSHDSTKTTLMIDQFQDLSHSPSVTSVNLYDVNPKTSLLNDDYDPRFTDPVFEKQWNIRSCDAASLREQRDEKDIILKCETR